MRAPHLLHHTVFSVAEKSPPPSAFISFHAALDFLSTASSEKCDMTRVMYFLPGTVALIIFRSLVQLPHFCSVP